MIEKDQGASTSGEVRRPVRWRLYRQDDNGNIFEIGVYDDQTKAERIKAEFEARGHKQTYWVTVVEA